MSASTSEQPGPYAQAAGFYYTAGWRGVLPLPARRKASPPSGWTGRDGGWPSRADVASWAESEAGAGNLGLRLPEDIIGVDVDAYSSKLGEQTITRAGYRFGELPPTWRSTSRDDGTSGIALYRVPAGLAWPGEVGPGVEIIQRVHRYVVAWPSIHPEGRVYRWITPDGVTALPAALSLPRPEELPELPESWVQGLTGGRMDEGLYKAELSDHAASAWLIEHGQGAPCAEVAELVGRYINGRLIGTASRHDAARDATAALFHLAAEGHVGVIAAVTEVEQAFRQVTAGDRTRAVDRAEWSRLYLGAIRLAAVDGASPPHDPCLDVPVLPTLGDIPSAAELEARRAAAALRKEVALQRVRRDARALLDAEDAEKSFREPPSREHLGHELAIVDSPVVYAVAEVMPAGANVLLTAAFKAGKTTMVNHLTRCLADGEPFLGRYEVSALAGTVALFNYEVDERQYRRWLREVGISRVMKVAPLNLRGYSMPLLTERTQDWIVAWLSAREVTTWIVDPFARAFVGSGDSENDNTQVGAFLDALDVIKSRAGVSDLVLPVHTGRAVMEVGAERARGATRLDDWADVRWMLTKDAETGMRYFSATGRDVEVAEMQLGYSEATRLLSVTGEGGRLNTKAATKDGELQNDILDAIADMPGISKEALRKVVHANRDRIDAALSGLASQGMVRVVELGRGRPTNCYPDGPIRVAEEADDD